MLRLRKVRILWLLVTMIVTPIIGLPWNTLGSTLVSQPSDDDDDDDGASDSERVAARDPWLSQGHSPRLPPPRQPPPRTSPKLFAVRQQPRLAIAQPITASRNAGVRLQI